MPKIYKHSHIHRMSANKTTNNTTKTVNNPKRIPKDIRIKVWIKHNGDTFVGSCFVCKNKLHFKDCDIGHIIPSSKGGSSLDIDNLRPLCTSCNRGMGNMDLVEYSNYFGYNNNKSHHSYISSLVPHCTIL